MSTSTATIDRRNFYVSIDTESDAIFETTRSVYREVTLEGVRGAIYTSERMLGTSIMRFYSETPGRRSKLPSIMFDGDWFVIEDGEIRRATYGEVKAGFAAFEAYKAL